MLIRKHRWNIIFLLLIKIPGGHYRIYSLENSADHLVRYLTRSASNAIAKTWNEFYADIDQVLLDLKIPDNVVKYLHRCHAPPNRLENDTKIDRLIYVIYDRLSSMGYPTGPLCV